MLPVDRVFCLYLKSKIEAYPYDVNSLTLVFIDLIMLHEIQETKILNATEKKANNPEVSMHAVSKQRHIWHVLNMLQTFAINSLPRVNIKALMLQHHF